MSPGLDMDWTLDSNWAEEIEKRGARNWLIKAQLLAGHSVAYRSSGSSLWPRVCSGDLCTYNPVTSADEVNENDIVFCEVQEGSRSMPIL